MHHDNDVPVDRIVFEGALDFCKRKWFIRNQYLGVQKIKENSVMDLYMDVGSTKKVGEPSPKRGPLPRLFWASKEHFCIVC